MSTKQKVYKLKPLCKWSGGKGEEIKTFKQFYPIEFSRYVEPFAGGAAVYFDLEFAGENVLNDIHPELVNFYRQMKNGHAQEIYDLVTSWGIGEMDYYYVRGHGRKLQLGASVFTPSNDIEKAAQFIYLRRSCFRGMIRYNSEGKFNIPWGKYKSLNFQDLINPRYVNLLQRTEIMEGDYKNVFDRYNSPENFFFIDQPYDSVFNDYGTDNFTRQNQIELFEKFSASESKCLMIVGGSDFIRDLYSDYIVHEYPKNYSFKIYGGRVGDEINLNHLVIKNY
jgi:DNA adenine methylase